VSNVLTRKESSMPPTSRDARESLDSIAQAESVAKRHSTDNGVFYLVWGVGIVLGLALFDVFSGELATALWVVVAVMLTLWTTLYMRRQPVRVKFFNHFIWWGFYYAAVLIAGIRLFPTRPFGLFSAIGLIAAAPILLIGLRK